MSRQHIVKDPAGKQHIILAPLDATPEEVISYAQKMIPPSSSSPQPPVASDIDPAGGDIPFARSALLGFKKRGSGVLEAGANVAKSAADAMGFGTSGIDNFKSLLADVQKSYETQGRGTGVKGFVGELVGDPLSYLPFAGGLVAAGVKSGVLAGATAPTGDAGSDISDSATNAAIGSAVGGSVGLLGKGAMAAFSGASRKVSPNAERLIRALEEKGINLTAAQKTGSNALANVEAVMENLPFTGASQRGIKDSQSEKYTRYLLGEVGVAGDAATPAVLKQAQEQLGRGYDDLIKGAVVKRDPKLVEDLSDIWARSKGRLGVDDSKLAGSILKEVLGAGRKPAKAGGIEGKVYHETRKFLTSKADSTSDNFTAGIYRDLRGALDGAFERSLPESKKGALAELNKKYGLFKSIQKTMDSSSVGVSRDAAITPVIFRNNIRSGSPYETIADAGHAFIRPQVNDSGTASRTLVQNALTGTGATLAGAGAMGLGPASVALGGALLTPKAFQIAYNSKPVQNYLINGLPGKDVVREVSLRLPRLAAMGYSQNQINQVMALPPGQALAALDLMEKSADKKDDTASR